MNAPTVEPLPYKHRNHFFRLLAFVFFLSLPFLFLYATGYRFHLGETAEIVSTGGLYIAAERTGAEIYIDNELVRETRVFRRAFYAQSITPGVHRVHVQKENHHTWVKELPVYPYLVTEAQAFNLKLVPDVRIIAPKVNSEGVAVLSATSSVMYVSSTTNAYIVGADKTATTSSEYALLVELFLDDENSPVVSTTTDDTFIIATTTKQSHNVLIYETEGEVLAHYIGPKTDMPYYYCAEEFELLGEATSTVSDKNNSASVAIAANIEDLEAIDKPIAKVSPDTECEPIIKMDSKGQKITDFDFFLGSSDLVLMTLEDGVYVNEIDDRGWQNSQLLLKGTGLQTKIQNGTIYVYDGKLIYQIILEN